MSTTFIDCQLLNISFLLSLGEFYFQKSFYIALQILFFHALPKFDLFRIVSLKSSQDSFVHTSFNLLQTVITQAENCEARMNGWTNLGKYDSKNVTNIRIEKFKEQLKSLTNCLKYFDELIKDSFIQSSTFHETLNKFVYKEIKIICFPIV